MFEPLGEFDVQHRPIGCGDEGRLWPVLLESMGRMGTTWAMRLLSKHPQIVVDPQYPHESRPSQYLTHLLAVLAKPADARVSATPHDFFSSPNHVGRNPFFIDGPIGQWFEHEFARELADLCGRSIDACYRDVARRLGKSDVRCFAEKVTAVADPFMRTYRELCGEMREVFLVRDLRDVLCSAKAFNDKRGWKHFGEETASTFAEFVDIIGAQGRLLREVWRQRRDRAVLLRYEDLLEQPAAELRRVLAHIGLRHDDDVVAAMLAEASASSDELSGHRTTSGPAASIGRWRTDLEPRLQEFCTEAYRDYLEEFGYR